MPLAFLSFYCSSSSSDSPFCQSGFINMASENRPHPSTNMAMVKSEQPKPENAGAKEPEQNTVQKTTSQEKSLGWLRLSIIGVGLWFAVFLYSLVSVRHLSGCAKKLTCGNYIQDTTIVSNAIPSITDEFHSTSDAGWYVSSM